MIPEEDLLALDAAIDRLQSDSLVTVDDDLEPDLVELIATAAEIRQLAETEWPSDDFPAIAAAHVADVLQGQANSRPQEQVQDDINRPDNDHRSLLQETFPLDKTTARIQRRRTLREIVQMAAAVLTLVLVVGLLAVVFQNQKGQQQGGVGAAVTATTIDDPALSALQASAGFPIYAPTWLPDGWIRQPLNQPTHFTGYREVQLGYTDAGRTQDVGIFESSPVQVTRSIFPANVYDSSVEIDLGDGRTGRIYQQANLIRLWWQAGDVAIQLETGLAGAPGGVFDSITRDQVVHIAMSMMPVAKTTSQPTPLTSVAIPITVTASGIPLTLQSVQVDQRSARLSFNVTLPADLIPLSNVDVIELSLATDVRVNGVPLRAQDGKVEVPVHTAGQTTTSFILSINSVIQPSQGAVVTISHITWVKGPIDRQVVSGPWAFNVTPNLLASHGQPTPNSSGFYDQLSMSQAQQLVGFPIIEPNSLPDVLTHLDFTVSAVRILPTASAPADYISFFYRSRDYGTGGVAVNETTLSTAMPFVRGNTLHWIAMDGKPTQIPLSKSTRTLLSISGVQVVQLNTVHDGAQVDYYTWQERGVYIAAYATLDQQVTQAVMKQLIASMLGQGIGQSTPTSSVMSTPAGTRSNNSSLTIAQAQQLIRYPIFVPTMVPTGLGLAHPSVRQILTSSIEIDYSDASGTVGLSVLEGPAGCCLDADPRKGGTEITLATGITAHFLNNEPQFGGPILWWDEGQTYVANSGPQLKQDGLVRVAGSMSSVPGSSNAVSTTTTPEPVPLGQENAIWDQVTSVLGNSINPILNPTSVTDGFDTVRLVSIMPAGPGHGGGTPSFDVQYTGSNKRLDIVVGEENPSLCGSGCTQSAITVRGQQATLQVNDAGSGHISLWWREPGIWKGSVGQPPGIAYWIFAQGLTSDQVQQIANSLTTMSAQG